MSIEKEIDKKGRIKLTVFFKDNPNEEFNKWFYSDTVTAYDKYIKWVDDYMEQIDDYQAVFTLKLAKA